MFVCNIRTCTCTQHTCALCHVFSMRACVHTQSAQIHLWNARCNLRTGRNSDFPWNGPVQIQKVDSVRQYNYLILIKNQNPRLGLPHRRDPVLWSSPQPRSRKSRTWHLWENENTWGSDFQWFHSHSCQDRRKNCCFEESQWPGTVASQRKNKTQPKRKPWKGVRKYVWAIRGVRMWGWACCLLSLWVQRLVLRVKNA